MHLTEAETLFIQRRRDLASQAGQAQALGIAEWLYVEYEQDKRDIPKALIKKLKPPITDVENCVLYRKRNNFTQQELADYIGCSRLWVIKMEGGQSNPGLLLDYWS